MRACVIRTIAEKELSCFFSSRRVIVNTFLLAAAMVPFMLLLGKWAVAVQTTSPDEFIVASADEQSEQWLASVAIPSNERVSRDDAPAMLRAGAIDAFVEYLFANGGEARVSFASSVPSSVSASALFNALNSQGRVKLVDISGVELGDSMAYSFLPAGLLVVISMSAGTLSAFLSVREREIATLEPLLSTGVARAEVIIGKYLAVLLGSLLSSLIAVASACTSMWILAPTVDALSPLFVVTTALVCVAVSVLFSALFLTVGFAAESQREAQGYIGVISTFTMAPSLFLTSGRIGSAHRWALIPVLNWSAIMRDALYHAFDAAAIALSLGVSVVLAAMLLSLASRFVSVEMAKCSNASQWVKRLMP